MTVNRRFPIKALQLNLGNIENLQNNGRLGQFKKQIISCKATIFS